MTPSRKAAFTEAAVSAAGALCCAYIFYCEKLQFFPFRSKACLGRLGIAFLGSWLILFALLRLIRGAFRKMQRMDWIPLILTALIASVCAIVWFPVPRTGFNIDPRSVYHLFRNLSTRRNTVSFVFGTGMV